MCWLIPVIIIVQWDFSSETLECVQESLSSLLAWKVDSWVFVNTSCRAYMKPSCLTTTFFKIVATLPFSCMPCCLNCVPTCCRRQVFEHPFREDPNNEDNFIEVDTRAPLVVFLSGVYTRLVLAWDDVWDNPN